MGKGQSFQQMIFRKLDIHMQRMKFDTYLTPYTEINSKCIKNKRLKTIKLLEGNIEDKFHDVELAMTS